VIVQLQRLSDGAGVDFEPFSPQAMADHGDRMRAGRAVVFDSEETSGGGAQPQNGEEIASDKFGADLFNTVAVAQVQRNAHIGGQSFKVLLIVAVIDVIRVRERSIPGAVFARSVERD